MKKYASSGLLGVVCLTLIFLMVLAVLQQNRAHLQFEYIMYFNMEYPETDADRRLMLPKVASTLFEMRGYVPDLELRSVEREMERTLWRFDASPPSLERYLKALGKRDEVMKRFVPLYARFANACRVAERVFATDSMKFGAMKEAGAMLHNVDCPGHH